MPSGKTVASRPLNYNGTLLTPPAPIAQKPLPTGGTFSIQDAINQAQVGQNAANAANNTRYTQGLSVLANGYNASQGTISQALADTKNLGNVEKNTIAKQETQGHSSTTQNAINRGLGNTTIVDSLQRGVSDSANTARLGVDDMVAKNRSAINLQAANNQNQGANSIAGYIANRNDNAPSLGDYASLVSAAAQKPTGTSTGTITKGSINDPINIGSTSGGGVQVPSSSGGALGSNYYNAAANQPTSGGSAGGGMGSGPIGGMGTGGGGGGGGGAAGGYATGGGTVANAIASPTGGADSQFSPAMAAAGYGKGSASITPTGNGAVPLQDAPDGYAAALAALRRSQGGMVYDNQYQRLQAQFGLKQ